MMAHKSGKVRCAQALLVAPGLFFLFLALHEGFSDYHYTQKMMQRAQARTAAAEATIIEAHARYAGGHWTGNGAGTFSFTTAAGQEIRVHYGNFSGNPGTRLPVRYDPKDPENCTLGDNNQWHWGFADVAGHAPFFLLGLYFLFLAMRLGRDNE